MVILTLHTLYMTLLHVIMVPVWVVRMGHGRCMVRQDSEDSSLGLVE